MTTTLWVEPALGAVSGGLRYNQQLRQALQTMGCDAHTLSLPPRVSTAQKVLRPSTSSASGSGPIW